MTKHALKHVQGNLTPDNLGLIQDGHHLHPLTRDFWEQARSGEFRDWVRIVDGLCLLVLPHLPEEGDEDVDQQLAAIWTNEDWRRLKKHLEDAPHHTLQIVRQHGKLTRRNVAWFICGLFELPMPY